MHHSFTWGEAAALLRVSGRTVIHAARVLSEDSPAVPAGRLAVEQGRITVSDAPRVMDEPAEVQPRALERVTGAGSRNLTGAARRVQDETSRQEDAAELESNRARPMAETITLHHSSVAGLDRQAWSGWRSPTTGTAARRSAQARPGQVVCDPVLLDRRAAELGSITVRFNDNFDDSTWYWDLRNYSGSIFPASRSLRRRSCASGRRLETSAQYSAE